MCLSLIVQSYTKLFKMLDLSQKNNVVSVRKVQRQRCYNSVEEIFLTFLLFVALGFVGTVSIIGLQNFFEV